MSAGKAPTPVAVALILCDYVIVEQLTNKITLVGMFDRLRVPWFPDPPSRLHVFVSLTDSVGSVPVRLVCSRASTGDPIYEMKATASFRDRLTPVNTHFAVRGIEFESPGEYFMQLYCNEELVSERKFTVYAAGE